ncbi:MAG: NUDIX domain-containing protein [Anaerolineae bacterium]|nr:NUDIX domain-containing protein [Anaerolineae bacterium]
MSDKPFALSIKVVIRDEADRCLLLRRSASSKGNPGKWEFPGGKVEAGEDFDAALLREVAEETGLTVSLHRVAGAAESEMPTRKVAYLILEGRLESGQVRLSSEHEDYAWVAPHDLLGMDLVEQFRPFAQAYGQQPGQP